MAGRGKRGNYQFLAPVSPSNGVYSLIIRQQPVKAKVALASDRTGVGEKKTVDPAIIVELQISDLAENPPAPDPVHYLYNPFLFAYATLLDPENLEEVPYCDDNLHIVTGSIASCVYHLKDPENNNQIRAFFVFSDIAIRQEGSYKFKISLYKIEGYFITYHSGKEDPVNSPSNVVPLQSVITDTFCVYSLKDFPPLVPTSILSKSFADQGLKLKIRKSTKVVEKEDDSSDETVQHSSESRNSQTNLLNNFNNGRSHQAPPSGPYPPTEQYPDQQGYYPPYPQSYYHRPSYEQPYRPTYDYHYNEPTYRRPYPPPPHNSYYRETDYYRPSPQLYNYQRYDSSSNPRPNFPSYPQPPQPRPYSNYYSPARSIASRQETLVDLGASEELQGQSYSTSTTIPERDYHYRTTPEYEIEPPIIPPVEDARPILGRSKIFESLEQPQGINKRTRSFYELETEPSTEIPSYKLPILEKSKSNDLVRLAVTSLNESINAEPKLTIPIELGIDPNSLKETVDEDYEENQVALN